MNMALTLDPILVAHCLELADQYLADTRPAVLPPPVVRCGPRAWYVVQTVVRGEDKVIESMAELGFETYRPMMRKEILNKRTGRRPVMREFPLFNRYLFSHLPLNKRDWGMINALAEIRMILGQDGGAPIAEGEIARFRKAEEAREFDVTKARTFPVGSRVRVLSGPFGGFSGLVTSLPGRGVVKAIVDLLGGLTPVDFPFDMVAPE